MNTPPASAAPAPVPTPNTPPVPDLEDWRTINTLAQEINQRGPLLTTHALRHHIAQAERNGLAPHVRRLGRKILISRSGFASWLASRPTSPPAIGKGGR